jgi:hypothetical protein
VFPAGALAIGGFVRSRWRGGRGGSYGFCMRDSRIVRGRIRLGELVKDVGESVSRSGEATSLVELAYAAGHVAHHVNYLGLGTSKDWQLMALICAQDYTFVTNNRSDFLTQW